MPAPKGAKLIEEVYRCIWELRLRLPINKPYQVTKWGQVQMFPHVNGRTLWVRGTKLDMLQDDLRWIYGEGIDALQIACALDALKKDKKIKMRMPGVIETIGRRTRVKK